MYLKLNRTVYLSIRGIKGNFLKNKWLGLTNHFDIHVAIVFEISV